MGPPVLIGISALLFWGVERPSKIEVMAGL